MAYNENVQLEFSLDQKETYLASGLTKKAEEYTNLFRYKREALIIANQFGIENNVFNPEKYKELIESRGITYAEKYKRYFLLKKEIVRIKEFLGFNKELGDDNIVIDDEITTPDDDEIETPAVQIEELRNQYYEVIGKEPPSSMKNNAERLTKKINEARVINKQA